VKKQSKRTVTPKLRFPEFRDKGKWELKTIEALARVTQGGTPDTSNADYWGGPINWLTPAEMSKDNSPYIESTNRTLSEEGLHNCSSELLPAYSVIISTRAPIGHLAINTEPMAINQGCRGLVPVNDAHFLYYSLMRIKAKLIDLGAGNTFKELSGTTLKHFELPTPTPAEQQKITDCLSSLDNLIAAEGRKLAALRDHKRGLMQQLFPHEGETVPQLRFPEFRGKAGWIMFHLGELCSIKTGKKDANEGAVDGRYPFFTCAGDHSYSHSYSFDTEAILVAGNANVGEVKYYKGKFEAYQRTYVLADFSGIDIQYLYAYLAANLRPSLLRQVQTSAMSYIKLPMLQQYKVVAPPSAPEQQKIADCLSSLDDLIGAHAKKVELLKQHKKGLMQQLFPAPEEQ